MLCGSGRDDSATLRGPSGDLLSHVSELAGERCNPHSRIRRLRGFESCVQGQDRGLKPDCIENPLDALARLSEIFQLFSESTHNVSIRHAQPPRSRLVSGCRQTCPSAR